MYHKGMSGAFAARLELMGVQDAAYGMSYAAARVCWVVFFILMLVWIVKTQNGFDYTNTAMGSQGYLNRKTPILHCSCASDASCAIRNIIKANSRFSSHSIHGLVSLLMLLQIITSS